MATVKERNPEVYIQRNEDPRSRVRTVPMEVLSLGFSRTGTMSLKAAFETLGINTWHFVTMTENPPDLLMWIEALQAKFEPHSNTNSFGRKEYDNLLAHWGAVTDQPAAFLAPELIAAYPEAKVILVERDVDRWYKSYSDTIIAGNASPMIPLLTIIDKVFIGPCADLIDLSVHNYFKVSEPRTHGIFNNPKFFQKWREEAKNVYRAHNEMIKRITPRDKLLVLQLEDGWEPLCKFLDKPIPDVPFPRVNETKAVQEKVNAYLVEGYRRVAVRFAKSAGTLVGAVIAGLLAYRWMS